MSVYNASKFIEDFARRTLVNNLRILEGRLNEVKNKQRDKNEENKLEKQIEIINKELNNPDNKSFDDLNVNDNYFEVTQIINSLVGLLVFPQQKCYDIIENYRNNNANVKQIDYLEELKKSIRSDELICLKSLMQTSEEKYISTYNENDNVIDAIRHMRNSIAHENLTIFPYFSEEPKSQIENIIFFDFDKKNKNNPSLDSNLCDKIKLLRNEFKKELTYKNYYDRERLSNGQKTFVKNEYKKMNEKYKKYSFFCLVVPVEKLQDLLIEICFVFISHKILK